MKKKRIILLLIIILSIISLIFIYNDDFLYTKEIIKVDSIKTVDTYYEYNELDLKEEYKIKEIKGTLTNTSNKGQTKTYKYEESYSSVVSDKFKVGDKLIVEKNGDLDLKRDFYVSLLLIIFIILIYIVGEYRGLLSVLTVVFNTLIFILGLDLYFRGINIIFICVIESIIFSVLSLFITGGINKKTISAVTSVFVSTLIILIMTLLISTLTNYEGINFTELSFLTVPPEDIIIPELLIGSLGAIMDVAITISSSIEELINKNKKITNKSLIKSSKEIGKDIMTTMSNVLFFTYLCGSLPIFVLAVRNGFSVINYVSSNFSLELTRFLVGSIGIIITIPVATFIAVKIFRRDRYE